MRMPNKNTKANDRPRNGGSYFFDIVTGVFQEDVLAPYPFKICLDYVIRTSICWISTFRSL